MKYYSFTFLCASLYVDIYQSLISPHISEVQKVCGLNSNSCNPFIFPNDWYGGVSSYTAIECITYTSCSLTNQIFYLIAA